MRNICAVYDRTATLGRRRLSTVNLSPAGRGPTGGELTNELRDVVEEALSKETVRRRSLFRYEPLARLRQHFFAGRVPYLRLWAFVVLELWMRRFIIDGLGRLV